MPILQKTHFPGLALTLFLAAIAWFAAPHIPRMNAVLLGLLLGVLVANSRPLGGSLKPGITFTSKQILNLAIVFLGFGVSFQHMADLGIQTLLILVIMILVTLLLTVGLARMFRCRTTTGWLVGFGTAICGSSAIAALSGSVSDNKEDAGIAIAVVNLLGLGGMLVLPALFSIWPVDETMAATLIGGTLHAVGNVAGAGFALGDALGEQALTIKLGRVALLVPALIFFNLLAQRQTSWRDNLELPNYLWGFLLAVAIVSFIPLPADLLKGLKLTGKILLTLAMTGIGLNISLTSLYKTGRIALGFGLIIFILQVLLVWGLVQLFS